MRCDRWRLDRLWPGVVAGLLIFGSSSLLAADYRTEYDKNIKTAQNIGILGSDLAGDQVNFHTGGTSFSAIDVSLPGNNGLSVALGRQYPVESQHMRAVTKGSTGNSEVIGRVQRLFGDWDLDIPTLSTLMVQANGWVVDSTTPSNRCSVVGQVKSDGTAATGLPPGAVGKYWHGYDLRLPEGNQSLLLASLPDTGRPSVGGPYHWTTNQNWWVSCLPSTANNAGGEGFFAISPDGVKYTFNWLSKRNIDDASYEVEMEDDHYQTNYIYRAEYFMLPTRIEDRFGNWVQYAWSNDAFARLQTITSSDGRAITLAYNADGYVSSVSDGTRSWQYAYSGGSLTRVTLPDGSSWQYGFANLNALEMVPADCSKNSDGTWYCLSEAAVSGVPTGYVIHPSGARIDFVFDVHFQPNESAIPAYPLALTQKTISGPGLTASTWKYAFSPTLDEANSQCKSSSGCPIWFFSDQMDPNSAITRRVYGIRTMIDEGLLLAEMAGSVASALTGGGSPSVRCSLRFGCKLMGKPTPTLTAAAEGSAIPTFYREEDYQYVPTETATSFVVRMGVNPLSYLINQSQIFASERRLPVQTRTLTQQGITFTRQVNSFDTYANPTSVTRSSSLGYSRSETTEYSTNTAKWVLGQVSKVTDTGTGKAMQQTIFDASTALPLQDYRFGLLQQTRTYNADGTLATVTDGGNHTTTFSDWTRGLPRLITYANATTQRATVSALGLPLTVTDELGYTTTYGYDALGRLNKITPPSGDTVAWNATDRTFVPVASSEYGLPAGHWKQTVSTGNGRTTTYYDGRWQPVLTLTEDTGNAATKSFTVRRFDALGRETFTAYPVASLSTVDDATLLGVRTVYDALGRVIRNEQDSELGVLTTTTEYLTGFQTRVTDPRNQQTTTSYQAFDVPSLDAPVGLTAPEGISTVIARDGFGKALTVTRSGPSGQN